MQTLSLSPLPYDYQALAPWMSETVLKLHHDKHHQAYVDGANKVQSQLAEARTSGAELDYKALAKEFSFHMNGHILHELLWSTLRAANDNNQPSGEMLLAINSSFGSYQRFVEEFNKTAISVEGSGWALVYVNPLDKSLMIGQVEKHNLNGLAGCTVIMALDVWEHAYYLDYQNLRAKFVEGYWNHVNWDKVNSLFTATN
jgi:Fe-Mn family superoxide dismutase